jgi:meso-butanediol dehydrogenase/(S,S)-butanediol dehydrogenase/diacetyl reductase
MRFKGKVALITGSSQNVGREIALLFSGEGADTILVGRDPEKGEKVKKEIEDKKGRTMFIQCDVTKVDQVEKLVSRAVKEFGRLDILINNVGYGRISKITDMKIEDWHEIIDVTLNSTFYCSKYALKEMIKNPEGGVVVNIASIDGLIGEYGHPAYNSGKAAMINLTRNIALDYADYNIRANAVCPGPIQQDVGQSSIKDAYSVFTEPEKVHQMVLDALPMGRKCTNEEVARAALFLASDDAEYITGTTLVLDGGLLAHSGLPRFTQILK